MAAAESLGIGQSNESVISALLQALKDKYALVRRTTAESLGKLEIKDENLLKKVLPALNRCLYDDNARNTALESIRSLLNGRPIPGYHWHSLEQRENRKKRIKRLFLALPFFIGLLVAVNMLYKNSDLLNIVNIFAAFTTIAVGVIQSILWVKGCDFKELIPWIKDLLR